jgi:hypothetical protein
VCVCVLERRVCVLNTSSLSQWERRLLVVMAVVQDALPLVLTTARTQNMEFHQMKGGLLLRRSCRDMP